MRYEKYKNVIIMNVIGNIVWEELIFFYAYFFHGNVLGIAKLCRNFLRLKRRTAKKLNLCVIFCVSVDGTEL